MERRPPIRPDWQANKRQAMEQGGGDWGIRDVREEEGLRRPLPNQPRVNPNVKPQGRQAAEMERGAGTMKIKCFKCGREGHHQANYTNPPLCYSCHNTGHIASHCPLISAKRCVKLCGFGIPGQGFYSLQVEISDAEVARAPVRGLTWDWKIKQLNAKEFLKKFPSYEVRSQISTCKSFDFETSQIKASVVETGITEEAVDELVAVWVKIYGIPKMARSEDYIKSIVELVGEFEAVEVASIRRDGPVRVRVACKDPRELYFSIHLYINKVGYMIRWEPKGYLPYENRQNPPDDDDKDDKDDEGLEDDMNLDDEFKNHDISRGRPLKGEGSQHESRAGAFSAPPTYKGKVSSEQGGSIKMIASKKTSLLKHPDLFESCTSLVIWGDKKQEMIAEQESQELEAPELSQNETRPEFSTLLEFDEDLERCQIPTDSDIERLREEEDREEEEQFPGDSVELKKIDVAANIDLGSNPVEIDNNIETLKAKELVQAKLAELNWKNQLEKQKPQAGDVSVPAKVIESEDVSSIKELETDLRVEKDGISPEPNKRGRAIQINACLSSVPSYAMEFYQLPEGVHKRFDKIRNRYYWAGNKLKGKYHMIASEGTDCLSFRRSFGPAEITEWEELKKVIDNLETSPVPDTLLWGLATNKKYTTKSMYRTLTFRGIREWKKLFRPKEEARLELMTDRIKMVSTSLRSPRMGVD
ncbi:hypothetical protein OsJ_31432 [Oryza sativa Japonica Group]|uniref:CCHC-type domain-containing protein n=1 Tax=Oryza sativa subsp. japonica TaxID=39947 RepID=B9G5L7_ORYSJ|nr:hypothetical protein OsJ_31432 [Oryza sativa Japonica Group]